PVAPPAPPAAPGGSHEGRRTRMLGWLLILGGAYLLLRNLHLLFIPAVQDEVFPVLLILGGLVLLLMRDSRR
ncbi:MAG TPA: hypothetical protein VJT33_07145, partial [bacterium]|nr:hypothetical protein [bacterium]